MNLIYNSEIVNSSAVSVGSKSTIFGPPCNMADADCVLFLVAGNTNFAAVDSSAYLHLQCSTYSSGGFANYGSTVASRSTCTADGVQRYMGLDCVKPSFQYIRPAIYRTTGNFSIVAMKYNLRDPGSTYHRDSTAVWGQGNTFVANVSSS
jgi:hypothetical protein